MLDRPLAIDVETTGLTWNDRMLCFSMAKRNDAGEIESLVINTGYSQHANLFGISFGDAAEVRDREIRPMQPPEARAAFHAFLEGTDSLVLHNAAFDLPYIVRVGILTREELDKLLVFDTMVYARCTGAHERVGLEYLMADFKIKPDPQWEKTKGKRAKLVDEPWDLLEHYSGLDAEYTLQVGEKMTPKALEFYDEAFITEDSEWCKLVSMLRVEGIQFDKEAVIAKQIELKLAVAELRGQLNSYVIEGPNARKSILKWIATLGQSGRLNTTEKGNKSIDEKSLRQLHGDAVPVVELILECRKLENQLATWIEAPLAQASLDDRVHPLFTVSGAKSNRLSCKEPNAQAFPRAIIKTLMSARPGYKLVAMDLAQAELRIAASFSREPLLAREFARPDADPHMATALEIFGANATPEQRQVAKQVVFLSLYGGGAGVLMKTVNEKLKDRPDLWINEEQAADIRKRFRSKFTAMARTLRKAEEVWVNRGYLLALGGKRIYASKDDLKRSYKAFDFLVQPSVAELIKKAMLGIHAELPEIVLVNQVHDDIWMEIPDDEHLDARCFAAATIMANAYPEDMREMTDPPINMRVDIKVLSDGLPHPVDG